MIAKAMCFERGGDKIENDEESPIQFYRKSTVPI
jgi:hypothetical protein